MRDGLCKHNNLDVQGYWVRCADCEAVRLGGEWITSGVQLLYRDQIAEKPDRALNICRHKNMKAHNFWDYCADCGEIFMRNPNPMCAHTKIITKSFWGYCAECGEVFTRNPYPDAAMPRGER